MNKYTKILWIIIILGTIFLAYDALAPKPSTEKINGGTPSQTQTSLQEEIQKEVDENKNQSDFINEGDRHYENQNYKEAIIAYKKALIQNPSSVQSLYKLGMANFKDNKLIEAREYFTQLKEIQQNTKIDILIGRTYINKEEMPKAISYFNEMPDIEIEVKYYKAILKILQKKHEEAIADLTTLKTLLNTEGPEKEFNDTLKVKIDVFLETYQKISINRDAKPQHSGALLSKAFIDAEEYSAAIPLLFDTISMQNNYRDAWIMLGYCYLKTGKNADALDALLQAKILDPKKPEVLFFLGITYAIDEKYDEAISYLNQAKEAGFEPVVLLEQKLADLNLIKKDYEKALQSYSTIIDSGIADINLYTKAIWICIEREHLPHRAIQLAEKAIKQFPEEAISYSLRGWAFVASEDYKKAKENLEIAIKMDPILDHAYLNLGWMYEKQNSRSLAKEYYKKAYTLGNGNSISNLAAIKFNDILQTELSTHYADISSPR